MSPTSASTTSTGSSYGQTLQYITAIKVQQIEQQRLAYQEYAKVLNTAHALGEKGDILGKVELLVKAIKSWSGSGALDSPHIVGGKLQLNDLQFWLLQAKHDPSFSRPIAEGRADTLETHIRHIIMRFDSAELFGNLFNEWLASGDSVAVSYQKVDLGNDSEHGIDFVDVGRRELHEQKEKFISLVFDDYPVEVEAITDYLKDIFSSTEAAKVLENLRKDVKQFAQSLQRPKLNVDNVQTTIQGVIATGLVDDEKRSTLKAFLENPTVLQELTGVLNMRLASLESWKWPKEGLPLEFRRHMNGKYRVFTDPDIIDALLLHYIGISWQVKLKQSFTRIFTSKAWKRISAPSRDAQKHLEEQLGSTWHTSIDAQRDQNRRKMFFMAQFSSSHSENRSYDDTIGTPSDESSVDLGKIKQKLLHIMTTECYLNTALHGTFSAICSDFEWFGPSLPHHSILTVLEFLGLPKVWLNFFQAFLSMPIRIPGEDSHPRIRKRGTPINYAISTLLGEIVIFIMDFAVNQRTDGLYLYRMHDDLWLWDADVRKVVTGWEEMKKYGTMVGLKFNEGKTGSTYIGPEGDIGALGLPKGEIRWGFLVFDPRQSRFVIDQNDINTHIVELRRQLACKRSVFGWVNLYNKYMAFFMRNMGGLPANCFSQTHSLDMIATLGRIQRELFVQESGGAVGYLRKVIKERFGVTDLPEGYFYFPIGSGGLELRNTMLELLALGRRGVPLALWKDENKYPKKEDNTVFQMPTSNWDQGAEDFFSHEDISAEDIFIKRMQFDRKGYEQLKENWDNRSHQRNRVRTWDDPKEEFMSFDEYTSLRESWLYGWHNLYNYMLGMPTVHQMVLVPTVREAILMKSGSGDTGVASHSGAWNTMDWYEKWVFSMYGEEVVKKFGGLDVVDPDLIPVGMVKLFRTSRMKLDQ